MDDIEIRRMLPSESEIVAEVDSYAYQNDPVTVAIYQSNGGEEARKKREESLIDVYSNRPHETFGAVHEGRIIGFIRSQPCSGLRSIDRNP